MIAACRMCGQLVTGYTVDARVKSRITGEDAQVQLDLQEFDALGTAFNHHIVMHHPQEATELAAVCNLTSKVYAMRQAQSSDEKFDALRGAWSETIKLAVFGPPCQAAADLPGSPIGAAPSPSSSSSSSPPSGS